MEANASIALPKASEGVNRTIYFYEGTQLKIEDGIVNHYQQAQVKADVEITLQNGNDAASILILQGKPISEPVMQYGPFVMNTKEEINQAFEDYHATQFGGWPWSCYDNVHPREAGRFAKHADGRMEKGV